MKLNPNHTIVSVCKWNGACVTAHGQSRGLTVAACLSQEISQGSEFIKIGNDDMYARSYVAQFNFKANEQEKKIHMLSGGYHIFFG